MRTLLRVVIVLAILIGAAVIGFGWWNRRPAVEAQPTGRPAATSGIDVSKARERGAEIGEKAAEAAARVQDSVAEAALTSKIKAKMATTTCRHAASMLRPADRR
jgi:hypothetical protein